MMMTRVKIKWVAAVVASIVLSPAWAQNDEHAQHGSKPSVDSATAPTASDAMSPMPGMDHSDMNHNAMPAMPEMKHDMHGSDTPPSQEQDMRGMAHGTSETGDMEDMNMRGGPPPPDARDPHAYSGGYELSPNHAHMGDNHNFGFFLADRFEAVRTDEHSSAAYDLQGWYGRIYDRAVMKAEGEVDNGRLSDARSELLWGHAIATLWDSQLGVRYDSGGEGSNQTWLALGVQGLAPYWFELDATAYVGKEGRAALTLEAEYELLLTQKWILQPRMEADFYSKADAERGQGSGLSELSAGIRLRYEIRREFAPYIGVEWSSKFGGTADFARVDGLDTAETQAVAGIRFWL